MKPKQLVRVGITQGDTNGVGSELILKVFSDVEMLDICLPVVYGSVKAFNQHRKAFELNVPYTAVAQAAGAEAGRLNFINCAEEDAKVDFGKQNPEAGLVAFKSLERAVEDLKEGLIDVLVTAPINKAAIQGDDFHFSGHTEYLQDRLGHVEHVSLPSDKTLSVQEDDTEVMPDEVMPSDNNEALMILCSDLMKVALVTTHLPVSEVAFAITQERVESKARLLYESLVRDFNVSSPRIAVLALNPHAGDDGLLGHEEQDIIIPAIKALSDAGMVCYGPYSADGFFGSGAWRKFDGILAMYHDQALAPFKSLSADCGVNFTAGLPFVRTSPDHGTAFDIAGKGMADAGSFRKAIYMAIDLYRNRCSYAAAHANPLPKLFQDKRERQ